MSRKNNKKFLTKNEFRYDLNPKHMGRDKKPHPTYITGKCGHKYLGNTVTHSRFTKFGQPTYYFGENPNKLPKGKKNKKSRISRPFWQHENMFGKKRLNNYRYSNFTRKKIKKFNKQFDKKYK